MGSYRHQLLGDNTPEETNLWNLVMNWLTPNPTGAGGSPPDGTLNPAPIENFIGTATGLTNPDGTPKLPPWVKYIEYGAIGIGVLLALGITLEVAGSIANITSVFKKR